MNVRSNPATADLVRRPDSVRVIAATASARADGLMPAGNAAIASSIRSLVLRNLGYGRPNAASVAGSWPQPNSRPIASSVTTASEVTSMAPEPSPSRPAPHHVPGG